MPLTSPEPDRARPHRAGVPQLTRRRKRTAVALAALTVASVASVGSLTAAKADVAAVGDTASDCAPAGFTRPAGPILPGYIYTPTTFNGTIQDPQPDDTFASNAAGHQAFTGRLQTRVANGREEFLVCAHVGTNTPDDALTPFAVSAPIAHPATIVPQVQLITPSGVTTTFTVDTPGLTNTAISHYANSTDPHEGILQMWVPFSAGTTDPGYTVRTEVRGTPALAGGGSSLVMGADEVFVHLGNAPVARNAKVDQAVGVALDDSFIAERPSDPGADDLNSILKPLLNPAIKAAIEAQAPSDIPSDWEWSPGIALGTSASGTLNELPFYGGLASLDVVDFNQYESRLQLRITGSMYPKMTLSPRAAGFVSIISGSCDVTAKVDVDLQIGVTIDLDPTNTRPVAKVSVLTASGVTSNVNAEGTLLALYTIFPGPMGCNNIEGDISDGVTKKMKERMQGLQGNAEIQDKIADKINTSSAVDLVDLTNGPIANATIPLPNGGGFGIANASYVQTAPANHLGGKIWIWHEGMDVAASLAVTDKGGTRFPSSYRPGSTSSVVSSIHKRTRPTAPGPLDTYTPIDGGVLQPVTPTTMPPVTFPGTIGTVPVGGVLTTTPPAPTTTLPKLDPTLPIGTTRTTVAPTTTIPVKGATTTTTVPVKVAPTTTPTTSVVREATARVAAVSALPIDTTATVDPAPVATATPAPAPTATVPGDTTAKVSPVVGAAIDPSVLGGVVLDPGTYPELIPTDFDLGLVVNGATVNQLSRALTAGAGDGTGILDLAVPVGNGKTITIRPSVPPMYLPNAPAGWSVNGPVRLLLPSARLSMNTSPYTVAADAMVGGDFSIDTTTNHLVPKTSSGVGIRMRFLHLTEGTNMILDPGPQGVPFTVEQIAAIIGPKTLDIMRGVEIPDLKSILGQSMVLGSLSIATTGGGHLGIYFNVNPNPARVNIATSWTAALDTKPTKLTATANPLNFPGDGAYSVLWTVRDGNVVKYQSAAPEGLTKSWSTAILGGGHRDGNCDDEAQYELKVTATISRNSLTQTGSVNTTSPTWTVPVNTHICGGADNP